MVNPEDKPLGSWPRLLKEVSKKLSVKRSFVITRKLLTQILMRA